MERKENNKINYDNVVILMIFTWISIFITLSLSLSPHKFNSVAGFWKQAYSDRIFLLFLHNFFILFQTDIKNRKIKRDI